MVGKGAIDELFDLVEREGPPSADEQMAGDEADDEEVEVILRVHVQPGAGRTAVIGRHGDALKIKVAAAPEGGRANDAVRDLLASTLGVPKAAVDLVSGATSRSKRVRIGPVGLKTLRRLLAGATTGDTTPRKGSAGTTGNAKGLRGVR